MIALAVVPGVRDPSVSGLPNGGVTVITSVMHSENNEDFDGWRTRTVGTTQTVRADLQWDL